VHSGRQTRLLRTCSVDASSPRGRACVNISTHPSKSSRRCLPACPAVAQAVGHDDGGSVPLEGGNHKGSLCSHISKHTRWYYSSCFVLDKTRGERRLCLVKRANLLALGPRRPPLAMGFPASRGAQAPIKDVMHLRYHVFQGCCIHHHHLATFVCCKLNRLHRLTSL
jgi:hypothetical protein